MTQEPEDTYRVMNMSLEEVQKLGSYRWRRGRPRTFWSRLEAFVFPIGLFYFMVSFAIPASGGTRSLLLLPLVPMLGWLIWMTYRDMKAVKRASEAFVNNPSVRKNGQNQQNRP